MSNDRYILKMDLNDYYIRFPEKKDCISYLEGLRWGNKPMCPYCYSNHYTKTKHGNRYHCNTCNTSYSVTVDTIFHKTRVDMQKWFFAINLVLGTNKKISSRALANRIKPTKDTSWRIINEIKNSIIKQDPLIQKIIQK